MKFKSRTKWIVLLFMAIQTFGYSQTSKKDNTMATLKTTSKTIVFVHGLFVNPTSWAAWKTYYESKGYTCYIPANPYHEGNPADLRANINPELTKVGFEDVVNNIVKLIDTLPEKPIVIGHSLAGLVVQKLIEMGKASAGICIDGAVPKNILPPLRTVKTMFPVIQPFSGNSPYVATKKWFHFAFCTTLTKDESDKVYNEICVPESRRIPRQTLYKSFAKIDLKKPHNPLLFIGGEKDNIIPARLSKKNAGAYKDKNSISDFKEFKGKCHYICGQDGWQEVADYILNWLK
jgi:pimeloyl-ACP methyl ester carboxylesterase